jgi:hypothetical protein
MPSLDDQVADVRYPGEDVGEDEDRIMLVEGIAQQEQGAHQA